VGASAKTAEVFLFTNEPARRLSVLHPTHSRNGAIILKSSKQQRFDARKKNKRLNAGEKRFERALQMLRTTYWLVLHFTHSARFHLIFKLMHT
jgi:hypothetical protein